jgi:hypothetical protein
MTEGDFTVYGSILVQNHNPSSAMNVSIADATGGQVATLDCGGTLAIPAASEQLCDYSIDLAFKDGGTNVADVLFNGIHFAASALYSFGEPTTTLGFAEINVHDTNGQDWFANGDTTWNYSVEFACSEDLALYTDGVYSTTTPNVATIVETHQSDSEQVTLRCFVPAKAWLEKLTTAGPEDIGALPFLFGLYNPQGQMVEQQSLNDAGHISFATELREEGRWFLRENLPDGWLSVSPLECALDVAYPASAGQVYTCTFNNLELSRVNVTKLTNGSVDPSKAWSFSIYEGAGEYGGTKLATASTFDVADGLLDFGLLNLSSLEAYTLCEENLPAGWDVAVEADTNGDGALDATVVTYNPGASDSGVWCVDFGLGTSLALLPGDTLSFQADNLYPQGAPRTPGYWKNWSTCTKGNQVETAAKNGGWKEGFWLLDNVLDVSIGGGITWDDILADSFVFPITSCPVAVDILSGRDIGNPSLVGDGKVMNSDVAYMLARNLLAAQANFAAGAVDCTQATNAAFSAERLLDQIDFKGTGSYFKGSQQLALQVQARTLATTLDLYNNGNLCH